MKKLFLTSGIIACMACPAFAAGEGFTTSEIAAGTENQTTHETTIAAACVSDQIGVTSESTTLVAQWTKNWYNIALDSNLAQSGVTTSGTAAQTSPIYAVVGEGVYRDKDNGGNFSTPIYGTGETSRNPFTANPVGDTVSYEIDYNFSSITGATYTESNLLSQSADTSAVRTLDGYYVYENNAFSTTNTDKMIDENYQLTSYGAQAASGASADQTWKAKWNDVTPATPDSPALYGYHFGGWFLNDNGTGAPGAIGTDTTVYAKWAPVQYNVTYSCGAPSGQNYGSPATASTTATFDATFAWAGNDETGDTPNCHRDGYHFTGWTCTATNISGATVTILSNGGTTYADDNNAATTADQNPGTYTGINATGTNGKWQYQNLAANGTTGTAVYCEAQWAKNVISITWSDPDGHNVIQPNTCTYTESVTVPATPSRTGYTFNGWLVDNE